MNAFDRPANYITSFSQQIEDAKKKLKKEQDFKITNEKIRKCPVCHSLYVDEDEEMIDALSEKD